MIHCYGNTKMRIRFNVVLRHALAVGIQKSQVELSINLSLLEPNASLTGEAAKTPNPCGEEGYAFNT